MALFVLVRNRWFGWLALGLTVFVLAGCGSDLLPLEGRNIIPQPTFVNIDVTPAPESPTATPWPFPGEGATRAIPDGLDPELFAPASPEEVIDLWTTYLTGAVVRASSDFLYFRGRGRFEGELHMCPEGEGYLDGNPAGSVSWSVSTSVGSWHEVALIHEVPGRTEGVSFLIGIQDGLAVRTGSTDRMRFTESDYCANSDPGIELPSFTAAERRLDERMVFVATEIEDIPWVNGCQRAERRHHLPRSL